ncbi:MAG TPA: hypothetical protein VNI84_21060 [Pyrinomonadaceae bacterium]|nr:hypothetical protein [Pyrinomonadaceae bacterium]
MPEQQTKVKILKKGKRKTPQEIEAEFESATVALIYAFVRRKPEKARKIFSEMLNGAV